MTVELIEKTDAFKKAAYPLQKKYTQAIASALCRGGKPAAAIETEFLMNDNPGSIVFHSLQTL
jgi:hypothetical protein